MSLQALAILHRQKDGVWKNSSLQYLLELSFSPHKPKLVMSV